MYSVKSIFYTLQGEGVHSGRAAVFLRFSGCNLWSGREQDRTTAQCDFCDTDFIGTDGEGGGKFASAAQLAEAVVALWQQNNDTAARPWIVCTGGEPLLQLDAELVDALHHVGCDIAVESNGTLPAPPGIDWLCISPKANVPLKTTSGDELKLVYPQVNVDPASYAGLRFKHFSLQPLDNHQQASNTQAALAYCLANPQWQLGIQLHKLLQID